jgi:hypothetical protein
VKAFALGFGLNDGAPTFSRLLAAVFGDTGGAGAAAEPDAKTEVVTEVVMFGGRAPVVAVVGCDDCRALGPLNGGIL